MNQPHLRRFAKISVNLPLLFLFAALFITPTVSQGRTINVTGRVFTQEGPMQGARVYAYATYHDLNADRPCKVSDPTDAQGLYALRLEQGEYFFTAKGTLKGRRYFSYHGGNPLRLGEENIWLGLMANEEKPPVYIEGPTAVQGRVTYKGKPVSGAGIAFYTLENKAFKGLGFLAAKNPGFMAAVPEDGQFSFPLSPGSYVVIARKIQGGGGIRPLRKGDLFCYASANPVEVKEMMTVRIEIPCYPKEDRLAFVETPKIKTNDYPTIAELNKNNHSGIKGKVTDVEGNPLQGVYVVAYDVSSSALSHEAENIAVTDDEGNYFIHLDQNGTYGLVARENLGAAPKQEELTGLFQKTDPWKGILFKTDQIIDGVHIIMQRESRN